MCDLLSTVVAAETTLGRYNHFADMSARVDAEVLRRLVASQIAEEGFLNCGGSWPALRLRLDDMKGVR